MRAMTWRLGGPLDTNSLNMEQCQPAVPYQLKALTLEQPVWYYLVDLEQQRY